MLHVPAGDPVGLVLSLHGGGGTGIAQRALTGFNSVADAHDLLVVYPDGYDKSWADGRGASPADRRHIDDVAFLVGLVSKLQHDYHIAPGHVFVTGMSNGGFMSNRLACDRADVFAAVAPVAGTLGVGVACAPSRPVSVWEAHGTADPLVPFKGGAVRGRGGLSHSISADAMVSKWRSVDGCTGDASMEALPDVRDGTVVQRFVSTTCGVQRGGLLQGRQGRPHLAGRQAISARGRHRAHHARARRVGSHRPVFPRARTGLALT